MSWRDRAIPVTDEPVRGSWRDRAIPVNESAPPETGYWSDVGKNAMEGLKEIPGTAMDLAKKATVAGLQSPLDYPRMAVQGIKAIPSVVGAAGKGLWQTGKDVFNFATMPIEMASDVPASQTRFGRSFRERPLSTSFNIASVALPAARLFRGAKAGIPAATTQKAVSAVAKNRVAPATLETTGPAAELPNFLEVKGAQGLNALAGIRGVTIEKLARRGQNPGTVGAELAKTLSDEGVIGKTATETFENAQRVANEYGAKVGAAREAIIDEAAKAAPIPNRPWGTISTHPELVDAETALKPIIDEAARINKQVTVAGKRLLRPTKQVADFLLEKAKSQGGKVSLEDIKGVMDEVGPLTHRGAPETQAAMSGLYAKLADAHDGMIQSIAKQANNPKLAKNLTDANKGYSRYMRILPDIRRAAAMESVGQMNLGGLFKDLKNTLLSGPAVSRMTLRAGSLLKKGVPSKPVSSVAKTLSAPMARQILKEAGGDKELARKLAAERGFTF